MKKCSFTGHRPKDLYGYDNQAAYQNLFNLIKETVRNLYKEGYTEFITGAAQGIDQLVFWAVHSLKREGLPIRNIVYLPFQGLERQWKKVGLFSQEEFRLMISLSYETIIITKHMVFEKNIINSSLSKRNHKMVDDTDLLVGFYHGLPFEINTGSGTAECLRYAKSCNKEIRIIDPIIGN